MARKTHDITVVVGEYENTRGEKKKRYRNIGSMWANDEGGQFLRLDAEQLNPVIAALARQRGQDSVLCSCFPVREDGARTAPARAAAGGPAAGAAPATSAADSEMDSDNVPF